MKTLGANNLIKSYGGRRVVDEITLEVKMGEIVGLLGPNGAGKTTTFYMIVGLVSPDSGRVYLNEEDVTHMPMYQRARMGIGYLPQEPSVFRKLTVKENILAILETMPFDSQEERFSRLNELLEEFELTGLQDSIASSLSGGERRRVEIARALAREPNFLLLDEPFAGIDPIIVQDLQEILVALKDRGIGLLITDHNVRETLGVCDRGYVIVDGKVLIAGTPDEISRSDSARRYYLGDRFSM